MFLTEYNSYLSSVKRFAKNTVNSYINDLNLFLAYFEVSKPSDLNKIDIDMVRMWIFERIKGGISPRTHERMIISLRVYFKYLLDYHKIKFDVFDKIELPRHKRIQRQAPEYQQIFDILDYVRKHKKYKQEWQKERDYLILHLCYICGLRISEALSLDRNIIDFSNSCLRITGKGGDERLIPLMKSTIKLLKAFMKMYPVGVGEKIFKSNCNKDYYPRQVQLLIQEIRAALNLSADITPHILRHAFATHIIEKGGDIKTLSGIMGHKNLSTTQQYVKISGKVLAQMHKKYHPSANGEG